MTDRPTYKQLEQKIRVLEEELIRGKQANEEKWKLDQQLFQSQKMDEIGQLAGGLAHALNNILAGIRGNTFLLQMDYDHDHPHYQRLSQIQDQVNRGAKLMKQLLEFTGQSKYEFKTISINELIGKNVQYFVEAKNEIEIDLQLSDNIYPVKASAEQILYVLLNIYSNLGHAMPKGGCIHIQTSNVILEKADMKTIEVEQGNYVMISMSISGIEIDEKMLKIIFEPFIGTIPKQEELGLAFVNGIIRNHAGVINAYYKPGAGCKFNIYLPASGKKIMQEEQSLNHRLLLFGNGVILLVDDEPLILDSASEMLKMLGYQVYQAASGQEAINLYTKNKHLIDLVILDMILPVMNGAQVMKILREINPSVKVIISSGCSIDGDIMEIMEMGCLAFIQKPYEFTNLSKIVHQAINSSANAGIE